MKKIISIFMIEILIIFYSTFCYANDSIYTWSSPATQTMAVSNNITEEYTNDTSNPLKLDCESAILIEQNTGKVLYSYNVHEKLRPASVTKIMSFAYPDEFIKHGSVTELEELYGLDSKNIVSYIKENVPKKSE